MKCFYALLFFCISVSFLFAQEKIELVNPSFEGFPRAGEIGGPMPKGWFDCGFPNETVPDVHPLPNGGSFKVTKTPQDGDSYLGMVVRGNDTWEAIAQKLSQPLKEGQCYHFSIYLCRSPIYESLSRMTRDSVKNYATPVKVKIWGGNRYCNKGELLDESLLILNTRWLKYEFYFKPAKDVSFICIEAFYKEPTLFPYNGNVLLDNASAIVEIDCASTGANFEMGEPDNKSDYDKKLLSYTKENWKDVLFENKEAELTIEAEDILYEIGAKVLDENYGLVTIRLALGSGKLAKDRIANVKNTLLQAGLEEREFSVKQVLTSDLRGEWDFKNDYLWIRFKK